MTDRKFEEALYVVPAAAAARGHGKVRLGSKTIARRLRMGHYIIGSVCGNMIPHIEDQTKISARAAMFLASRPFGANNTGCNGG